MEPLWSGAGLVSMAFVSLLSFVLNFVGSFAVGTIVVVGCGEGGKVLVSVAFLVILNIVCIYLCYILLRICWYVEILVLLLVSTEDNCALF